MVQNNQGEFLQPKTITPKIYKYLKKMTDKSAEHEKLVILSFNSFPFSQFVNVNPDRYQYGELLPSHCVVPCIRFIYDRSFHFLGSLFFYREYLERNKAKFSKDMSECIKLYILALANINLKVVATVSPCIQIFIRAIQILAHIPYLEQFDGIISYSVGSNKNIFHIHDPSHIQSELINIFLNYDFHFNLYGVNYLASKNHILESMKLDNRPLISRGPDPEEESLDQGKTIGEYYLSTETSESIRRHIRTEALPAEALGTRLLISMLRGMFHNFYANTEDAKIIMFNEERLQDMAQFIKSIKMIENKTDAEQYSQYTGRVDPRKSKMVRNLKDIDSYIDKQNSEKRDTEESAQFKENAKKLEYNIYSEMCNVPDAIQQNPNIVISTASGKTLSADSPTIKKKRKKNAIPPEIRKELIRARIAASEASKLPTPVKEKGKTRNIEALPAKKESPKVSLESSRVLKVSSATKQKSAMNSMELKGKVDSSESRKDGINEQLETTKQKVTEKIKVKSRRRKNSELNTQQSSMDESNTGQNSEETEMVNTKDIPIPTDQIHHRKTDARIEPDNKNKLEISKSPSKSIESQIEQTVKDESEIKRRSPVDLEISEALMMLSGQQMAQQSMAEIREKMEEAKVTAEEFEFDDLPELVEDSDQEIDIIPVSVTEFESSSSEVQDIMAEAKANYEKYFKKDRIHDSDENSKVNLSETKNMEKTKSNGDNKDTENKRNYDSGNNPIPTALEKGNADHTQAKTENDEVPELVEESGIVVSEKESEHKTKVNTDKNYHGGDLDSVLQLNASEKGNKFDTKTSEIGEDPVEASELTLQGKYEIVDSIEDLKASNLVGKSRCTISEVDNFKANTSKYDIGMDDVPDLVDDIECSQDKMIKRSEIKQYQSNLSETENINIPKTSTTIDIVDLQETVGDLESTISSVENNESIEANLENINKSATIVDSIEQKVNTSSRVKEQIEDDGVTKPESHEIERKHLSPIQTSDNMISPPSETKKKINLHLDNVKKLEFDDGSDKENLLETRSLNSDYITDVGEQIDTPLRLETIRDFTKSEIPDTDLLEKERNLRIALGVEKSPKQDNTADFQPSDLISKDSMGILVRKYLTRDQIKEILGLDAEVDTESKFDSIIDCLRDTNTQNSEKMKSSKYKPEENLIKISWKDGDTVSIQKVNADSVKPLPKDPFKKSDLSNAGNITDITDSATNKPLKDMNTEESLSDHSTETADSIPDFPDEFDDDTSSWGGIVDEQVKLLVESLDDDIKSGSNKSTANENLPVPNDMRKTGAIKKTYERKKKESTLDCDYKSCVNFKKFVNKLCMFLKETSKIYYLPYSPDEYLEKAVEECEKLFAERRNFISTGDGIEVGSFYIKLFCSLLGPDVYRLPKVRTSLQTVIEELDLLAMAENETNSGTEDGFIKDEHLLVQNLWIHNVMGIRELFGSLRDYEVLDELAPDLFRTDHVRSIMKHIHKHSNDPSTLQINDDCIPLNIRECFDNLKPQGSVLLVE